ncbi:hypothetical protein C8T65DRAFT_741201 [Cerioporus squamosus]|nr:hypothetical protein C8T65DRAFT_741201 [Cerioporus squamosus]
MSNPKNNPQNAAIYGTGATTPGGSIILVPATPSQASTATQNDGTSPVNPLTPPASSPALNLSAPGTPNVTSLPLPATQPTTRALATEVDSNIPNATQAGSVDAEAMTGMLPVNEVREAQARLELPVFFFPRSPDIATDDSSRTAVEDSSSSPINVSFGTTTASSTTTSPTIRAVATRDRLAADTAARPIGDSSARTQPDRDTTGGTAAIDSPDALATPPGLGLPPNLGGAPIADRRTCQERAISIAAMLTERQKALDREAGAQDDYDYFSHFATPPVSLVAQSQSRTRERQRTTARVPGDENENPHGPYYAPIPAPSRQTDVGTGRKRIFAGTPDPEGERRSTARPRRVGTTPAMRRNSRLPGPVPADANPWAEGQHTAAAQARGSTTEVSFLPLASSTPTIARAPSSTPRLSQQQLRQHLARAPDSPVRPRPRVPAYSGMDLPLLASSGAARWRQAEDKSSAHSTGSQSEMDIDEPAQGPNSAAPKPSKGKGKARATTAEPEDSGSESEDEPPERIPVDWDEDELARAREESLRQTLRDHSQGWAPQNQSGMSLTSGAGPSRSRGDSEGRHTNFWSGRDAHDHANSSAQVRSHWTRYDEPAAGGRRPEGEAGRQRTSDNASSVRSPSAFFPLPNMRAAEYLAAGQHADDGRAPLLTPRTRMRYQPRNTPAHDCDDASMLPDEQGSDDLRQRQTEGERTSRTPSDTASRNDQNQRDPEDDWGCDNDLEWDYSEDGEILPSALRQDAPPDNATPTPVPDAGFPVVHFDDPEMALRGMAIDWLREIWSDAPNEDVIVQPYNYHYTKDVVLNRRVADALRWAFEQISGEVDFDVVPPELEDGARRRLRNLPSIWVIRGLSPRGTAAATSRGTWSFNTIPFTAAPRTTPMQSWLFTLEGYLRPDAQKIQAAVMRILMENSMRAWIIDMISANPSFADWPLGRAFDEVIGSLQVEVLQLGNGNYVANVHIRSPTRDILEWRRWVEDLRSRRYRSFAIGTGRVRHVVPCSGCTSVAHPAHLCPFPRIRGWNGPAPGEGVFRERSTNHIDCRNPPTTQSESRSGAGRGPRRDERERRSPRSQTRGGGSRQDTPRRRWNDRNVRSERGSGTRGRGSGRGGRGGRGSDRDTGRENRKNFWYLNPAGATATVVVPGRAIQVTCRGPGGDPQSILCIYAPTSNGMCERRRFFTDVQKFYEMHPECPKPHLMAGDFNNVEDSIDRLPVGDGPDQSILTLDKLKRSLGMMLADGWRVTYPNTREYTFHRGTGHDAVFSRLDRIYVTPTIFDGAREWRVCKAGVKTDHSLILVQLTSENAPIVGSGRPLFPLQLLRDRKLTKAIKMRGVAAMLELDALEESGIRSEVSNSQRILYRFKTDVTKLARYREREVVPRLLAEISDCEKALKELKANRVLAEDAKVAEAAALTKQICQLKQRRFKQQQQNSRAMHRLFGDRPTKYWSKLHRECAPRDVINSFEIEGQLGVAGEKTYEADSGRMAAMARAHHMNVQRDGPGMKLPDEREGDIREALDSLEATVTDDQAEELGNTITYDECILSLRFAKNGTAPGLDGIPFELWKTLHARYMEDARFPDRASFNIARLLTAAFKDIQAHGVDETTALAHGWMAPIYKEKGERTKIVNYRPITLLNTDYKLLSKILADGKSKIIHNSHE